MDNSIKGISAVIFDSKSVEPHRNSNSALPPGTLKITERALRTNSISLDEDTDISSTGIENSIVPSPCVSTDESIFVESENVCEPILIVAVALIWAPPASVTR